MLAGCIVLGIQVIISLTGTHVPFRPYDSFDPSRWRNRKGFYSSNIMLACDHLGMIRFASVGYEGSAADQTIFIMSTLRSKTIVKQCFHHACRSPCLSW